MKQNIFRKIVYYFGCISIAVLLVVFIKSRYIYVKREQKIKEIADYNLQVYNMISYGDPGEVTNINEMVRNGVGHCGIYSTLLWYILRENGYECQIINIKSISLNAMHTVVECKVLDKRYIFDPTNGIYYKNSLEELCSNPTKANNKIYQINEEAVMDVYASDNFWSGVYQTMSFNNAVMRDDSEYYSDYIDNINYMVNNVLINSEKCNQTLLLDNNPKSNITIDVNSSDFVEIEINLTNDEQIGILAIDFLETSQSLKNIKLFYFNSLEDRFIILNEGKKMQAEISSEYEFFLKGIRTNRLKIVGEPAYNDTETICLNEIILLECIDICDYNY